MFLQVNNLKKQYNLKKKNFALRGVDMSVAKGEFIAVMGPSGSGKTTLLNMISTIDTPGSGEILIEGKDITGLKENEKAAYRAEYLGFIFQDYNLVNNMTVKENIMLPLIITGRVSENDVEQIAERLGIHKLLDKFPFELSGGEKQRTGAARALVMRPDLLLADEPTGNLDTKSASDFLKVLKDFNEEHSFTTLLVTHDPYVASFADRVFILKDGKVFAEINSSGSAKDLHNKLINSLNLLGGE